MTVRQIIDAQLGKRYLEKNYKDALRMLEEQDRIEVEPRAYARPRRAGEVTFGPKVRVTFPKSLR